MALLAGALLILACSSEGSPAVPPPASMEDASAATGDAGGSSSGGEGGSSSGDAATTGPACAALPLPSPCGPDATNLPPPGTFGATGPMGVIVETFANPRSSAPLPVSVYLPAGAAGKVPVLFFSHAFGAIKVEAYDVLLRVLASNGIASVYVPYSTLGATHAERYSELWDGFLAASVTYANTFDLTRVGFAGHSFGGGATPEMARRGFVEKGWGSAGRFMFVMAPWYSWGSGYETLPADVRTVMQVYADDDTNDHEIAVQDIWNKLPNDIERRWLMIRSDACTCGLNAGHTMPISVPTPKPESGSTQNGHDAWGVARRIHALAAHTFTNDAAARAIAYGEDVSMGAWIGCGGRSIRPLEASATPIIATCGAPYRYPLSARCTNADPGVSCP